ncbi:UNVERIFIED_CONTAM: hypothetical protein GTU68_031892 [Idotea baltica]|nr:hypothetical protein [Idotea baltica]
MNFPEELKYTEDHEWIRIDGDVVTVGITDFAQKELGDIVYVEIETQGETLEQANEFGTVEAVKTVSELFMPVSGEIIEVNEELLDEDNATWVNESPYEKGWMVKIKISEPNQLEALMDVEAYKALLGV